ncbi:caspase family protein [Pseudomonas aeruginosa]|nr:caspase family protein [Pseudomonas aeruginosa]
MLRPARSLSLCSALVILLAACGEGEPLLPADARLPDGARDRGELVDGRLEGQGRLDYDNGAWYAGRFEHGLLHGHGTWQGADGSRYSGGFAAGLFDGQGRLAMADGSVYQGGFRQGLFDGEGSLEQQGTRYRGGFRKGLYSGQGTLDGSDGSRYQGSFRQGRLEGEGSFSDSQGNQYAGTFRDGQLNGKGRWSGPDGDRYVGQFKDNQFHGQGRYESASGDVWIGRFSEGALNGPGELLGADGSRYRGGFQFWRFHGQGLLEQLDGTRYEGGFAAGAYAGQGTLDRADGSREQGLWADGKRIRDAAGKALPDTLEIGLLAQGRLLDEELRKIPASTPASELYALSLGGDGRQGVFLREADYAGDLLGPRFAARGVIRLVNHRDHFGDRPLATRESLSRAVRTLAERSGPEDLVFIYLTSHGSSDHQLALDMPGLNLGDLPAAELAELLAPLRQRDKVLVVSACYSGGFIPPLKDERTLILTAARADRVSFGCSDDADFTYFGRALLANALNRPDDLSKAFELAKEEVRQREKEEGFEASEPQAWLPERVLAHWRTLRGQQAERALASREGKTGEGAAGK